ncbi:TIGR02281 family clan AA aspartic protease [Thalassobium sp. R2A62]|uniref:retropepsin-like aspartic protease family protein n=1 Tax=Thalassobium sp. R2A62 TaxID=633131 RepID=UPI0001B1CE47|nr:TIGR02281 family clan AA aspartic protease [Thalassobium sp. R2A62]EET47555.1 retroviral aspartyl protease family protein [Thalassobium sp. R2A62]
MTSDQIANFAYLALMGTAVAGWFFAQSRQGLGKSLQQAIIWGMIFLGVIAAVGLWTDIQGTVSPRHTTHENGIIEIPRSFDGHYNLTVGINGVEADFVVDTGATMMVLTLDDAAAAGIELNDRSFFGSASTANGIVRTAPIVLDSVTLGHLVDRNVRATVNEGELDKSLLGMSYLSRFSRIEIAGNKMLLTP